MQQLTSAAEFQAARRRLENKPWNVTYQLANCPASYDFLQWLLNCELERHIFNGGPMRVRFAPGPDGGFRKDNLPRTREYKVMVLQNVMRPALKLIGATEVYGNFHGPERRPPAYFIGTTVRAARMGLPIPKWRVPDDVMAEMRDHLGGRKPVVVTLREASHFPKRNSNIEAWTAWARNSGEDVIFVRDTVQADEPIAGFETCPRASRDLLWRAALTVSAKCNLSVGNGPAMLQMYSDAPWLMFVPLICPEPNWKPGTALWWRVNMEMKMGHDQFPWSRPDQQIVWESDGLPAIERAWEAWKAVAASALGHSPSPCEATA